MNILIPMAGQGQRFVDAGYKLPKPLIDVNGRPMIARVVESLGGPTLGRYIFVVQALQANRYAVMETLREAVPSCEIVVTDEPTAGAACTALLARGYIDNDEPLLIANSDQIVRYEGVYGEGFKRSFLSDGVIFTFQNSHPKWSYAAVDEKGQVWGVAEKQVISDRATCGIYWFRKGKHFVRFARTMIEKNLRVNNEFYIAPVYNQMIGEGWDVVQSGVAEMWGLGTPEDLERYLRASAV